MISNYKTVDDRRTNFIDDIVNVCKKHRVLFEFPLEVEWDVWKDIPNEDLPAFVEHSKTQFNFQVSLADIEQSVREAVMEQILNPEKNNE